MKMKWNPKQWKWIIPVIALLLMLVLVFAGADSFRPEEPVEESQVETEKPRQSIAVSVVMRAVKSAVGEMKLVLEDILENDLVSARSRIEEIQHTLDAVKSPLDQSISLVGSESQVGKKLVKIKGLLETADMALTEIAFPAIDLLEEYPITNLKAGDGFNTALLGHYLDFAESVMPQIETVVQCANSIDLKELDSDGELTGYLDLADRMVAIYRTQPDIFAMVKTMIGAEEDRLYVVAVQNPVEIRASGGFPGSVGTMRIQNGILTMGEFRSVLYAMSGRTPADIRITQEERELYYHLSGIQTPWDADLCPDFERVGHIWASSFEEKTGEKVSGVISVTPHIVPRILTAAEKEIELFDGLVLNGENAMEVLLHDIYFKYFSVDYVADRGEVSDALFADAAAKTMDILTDDVSMTQLLKYLPILQQSVEDRTLMMWMKDEAEQAFIISQGWSGGLNTDPEQPEAGVYFNCVLASKMGWYFLMDTEVGEGTKNEDGSYTYPVTVTFRNTAVKEEIDIAATYISGGMGGSLRGAAYFFAPAGGTVSDFTASNGQTIRMKTYHGLELGFMDSFVLKPDIPITVTYLVTTAPGVEAPLGISRTPTAQQ